VWIVAAAAANAWDQQALRREWAQCKSLAVRDSVLECHWQSANRKKEDSPESHLLQQCERSTGRDTHRHIGTNKTIDKVQQCYYWLHLRGNVERWYQQCDVCHQSRYQNQKSGPDAPIKSQSTISRESQLTSLGLSQRAKGETYLLIPMVYFTKQSEVYAIPNQDILTVADAQ